MKYLAIYTLFMIQFFCSCGVVDDPIPVQADSTAKFYLKAYVDGSFMKIKTDSNNYYMNTGFDYISDSGYYRFYGYFAPEECSNCLNTFRFNINDALPAASGAASNIDKLLKDGAVIPFDQNGNGPFNRIWIEYTDNTGKKFSTAGYKQTTNFNIVYSKDYRKNKYDKKTKQVKAIFDCVLQSTTDAALIYVDNAEVVFSVACP